LGTEFGDIEYLDFSKFPLSMEEYGDLEHLNEFGAKRFSIWFNKMIKDGLLEMDNKQKYINEEFDLLSNTLPDPINLNK
jgi:hypothetical protein